MGIPKSNLSGVTRIPKLFLGFEKADDCRVPTNSSMILNGSVSKHPHDQLRVQGVRKNDDLRDGSWTWQADVIQLLADDEYTVFR